MIAHCVCCKKWIDELMAGAPCRKEKRRTPQLCNRAARVIVLRQLSIAWQTAQHDAGKKWEQKRPRRRLGLSPCSKQAVVAKAWQGSLPPISLKNFNETFELLKSAEGAALPLEQRTIAAEVVNSC